MDTITWPYGLYGFNSITSIIWFDFDSVTWPPTLNYVRLKEFAYY
jgi:hypothetical protein